MNFRHWYTFGKQFWNDGRAFYSVIDNNSRILLLSRRLQIAFIWESGVFSWIFHWAKQQVGSPCICLLSIILHACITCVCICPKNYVGLIPAEKGTQVVRKDPTSCHFLLNTCASFACIWFWIKSSILLKLGCLKSLDVTCVQTWYQAPGKEGQL